MLEVRQHHGLSVSSVGIGTWAIGGPYWTADQPTGWSGPLDDADSELGLRIAVESGLTHIDTADVYGIGRSERLVAPVVGAARKLVTLASKVGFVATSAPSVYSPENIRFQCEQSLRNLRVSELDIYYIHHCDFGPNDQFLPAAAEEFGRLRDEGLIRSVGLSGYSADALIRIASVIKPDFIQSWASIEHREFIDENGKLSKFMMANDIKFIAMMPFGQGRVLGKYRSSSPPSFGAGDNRSGNPEFSANSLGEFEPKLRQLRSRFGETCSDLITPALGFLLQFPTVVSVIPGFRNSKQVREIVTAVQRPFSQDDRRFIEDLFPMSETQRHPWTE